MRNSANPVRKTRSMTREVATKEATKRWNAARERSGHEATIGVCRSRLPAIEVSYRRCR